MPHTISMGRLRVWAVVRMLLLLFRYKVCLEGNLPRYATQNVLGKSIASICYENNPQFIRWLEQRRLGFWAYT